MLKIITNEMLDYMSSWLTPDCQNEPCSNCHTIRELILRGDIAGFCRETNWSPEEAEEGIKHCKCCLWYWVDEVEYLGDGPCFPCDACLHYDPSQRICRNEHSDRYGPIADPKDGCAEWDSYKDIDLFPNRTQPGPSGKTERVRKMKRLTTGHPQGNVETALNLFYIKNGEAWVRGGGPGPEFPDVSLFDYLREIVQTHGLEIDISDETAIGLSVYESLFDGIDTLEGIVATLYTAGWAFAELRARLELYENICYDAGGRERVGLERLRELAAESGPV